MNSETLVKLVLIVLVLFTLLATPAMGQLDDRWTDDDPNNDPNTCFESGDCVTEADWKCGWSDARHQAGLPGVLEGCETPAAETTASRSSAATAQENGVIATSTQACIDRGQAVWDELLEADKLIDGEESYLRIDLDENNNEVRTESDNNQRTQRLIAVMEKYPISHWHDNGCPGG